MTLRNYRDLIVWRKAMDLVEEVYRATREFPREGMFCLVQQLRRAAISTPSNIAEGEGRGSSPDFIRFLKIAYGSLREVETQLMISQRLGYIGHDRLEQVLELSAEIGRMLNGLIRSQKRGD